MSDSSLHAYAMIGTLVAVTGMGGGVYYADQAAADAASKPNPYDNMVVIDAALAEKSSAQEKQPQKDFRAPPPPEKPEGVSRDEKAPPVVKPDKPPPDPTIDPNAVLNKNRSKDDDDELPVGKPKIEIGRIDGSEVGFGDKTFGDPYLGALKSGFMRVWEYPEILSDVGTPIGCIRLEEDGSIKETKLLQSSDNPELDDSVERALTEFQKKNNKEPKLLPDHLSYLLRMPLCWRLKV
jgi:TonB C terminal